MYSRNNCKGAFYMCWYCLDTLTATTLLLYKIFICGLIYNLEGNVNVIKS